MYLAFWVFLVSHGVEIRLEYVSLCVFQRFWLYPCRLLPNFHQSFLLPYWMKIFFFKWLSVLDLGVFNFDQQVLQSGNFDEDAFLNNLLAMINCFTSRLGLNCMFWRSSKVFVSQELLLSLNVFIVSWFWLYFEMQFHAAYCIALVNSSALFRVIFKFIFAILLWQSLFGFLPAMIVMMIIHSGYWLCHQMFWGICFNHRKVN